MRKNTLLFGVLSLFGASQAMADDWVIELMKNNASHLELVKDASFDVGYGCIGNTSTETVIGLGGSGFRYRRNKLQSHRSGVRPWMGQL